MTEPTRPPLFRPEAVAHHQAGREERRPVDFDSPHTLWAFRGLLALIVVLVLVGSIVRADETTRGQATVARDGETAELLLPAGAATRIRAGQRGEIDARGTSYAVTVTSVGRPRTAAGRIVLPVTVTLRAPDPALAGASGEGRVTLARTPVIALVASGFRRLWTSGG